MTFADPLTLRSGVRWRNRLVLAPMTTYSSLPSGEVSPDEVPYYARRAAGGLGAVITAACAVHPTGWAFRGQWQCWDDRFLPGLAEVAETVRFGGASPILQIHHGGRACPPDLCGGTPLSASDVPSPREGAPVPRAMTVGEIETVVAAFADAARRAERAGYDGVEIHGANTYLLQQFVSPHSNRRTDAWAEPLRFSLAVFDAVRAAVSPGFAVGYRFSPEEPEDPGLRLDRTFLLVDALAARGADYLHVSLREYGQPSMHEGGAPLVRRLSSVIAGRSPLISVGAVRTAADASAALSLGADAVAVGRAAVADPEWGRHALGGLPTRPVLRLSEMSEVPAGLAAKIRSVPGWFETED